MVYEYYLHNMLADINILLSCEFCRGWRNWGRPLACRQGQRGIVVLQFYYLVSYFYYLPRVVQSYNVQAHGLLLYIHEALVTYTVPVLWLARLSVCCHIEFMYVCLFGLYDLSTGMIGAPRLSEASRPCITFRDWRAHQAFALPWRGVPSYASAHVQISLRYCLRIPWLHQRKV